MRAFGAGFEEHLRCPDPVRWLDCQVLAPEALRNQTALSGKRVRLEPLTVAVLDEYWAMLQDPELKRLTGTHAEFTREQAESWLSSRHTQHDRADWAIISNDDGAFLGEAVILDFDAPNETAGYRIALAGPHVYGRGHGTEATSLVIDYALNTVGLHRLQLEVFEFNTRAIHVYEHCGFIHEGRRRDALLWNDQRHDALIMAVLRNSIRDHD
jgi:RimJ/RimL family protein N-acetyltransferase